MCFGMVKRERYGDEAVARTISSLAGSNWLAAGNLSMRLIQTMLLIVALRGSNPSEYGQFALASAIVAISTYCAEGGLIQATASNPTLRTTQERRLAGLAVAAAFAIYALSIVVSLGLASFSGGPQVLLYSAVLGTSIFASALASVSIGRLQRLGSYRTLGVYQICAGVLSILIAAPVLLSGAPIWALIAQSWSSTVLFSALCVVDNRSRLLPTWRRTDLGSVRSSAVQALIANLAGVVGRRADDLIVGGVLGAAAAGQYGVGYRFLTVSTEVLLQPGERVALTTMGAVQPDSDARSSFERTASSLQRRLTLKSAPVFLIAGAAAYFLTVPLLGEQWWEAALVGALLSFSGAIQSTYWLTYATLFVAASPSVATKFQLFLVSGFLGGVLAGLPWGVVGCAGGYLGGALLTGLVARNMKVRAFKALSRSESGVLGEGSH